MKRFLLICCLFTATGTATFAQSQATTDKSATYTTVSKSDYMAKVTQLNTLLTANNADQAKTKWEDIHNMIKAEFRIMKQKFASAKESKNDAEVTRLTEWHKTQYDTYLDIMHLKENMAANKTQLVEKLNKYGANIL